MMEGKKTDRKVRTGYNTYNDGWSYLKPYRFVYDFEGAERMEKKIVRVENPLFMTHEEIRDKYWGNQVLMTNIEFTGRCSGIASAIVRFYGSRSMMEMWRLLDRDYNEGYGSCTVVYIGDVPLNLYAGGDIS